jgi:hypothetical protein
VQGDELGARVEPELVCEERAQLLVALQGLPLAPCAVQRPDQAAPQPLPQRVCGDEPAELDRHRRVLAEAQLHLRRSLVGEEPLLGEVGDHRGGERGVGEVGQGGPAPEPERLGVERGRRAGPGGARLDGEGGEAAGVDGIRCRPQGVPGRPGRHERAPARLGVLQRPAQLRDLRRQCRHGRRRRPLAPDVVDQPVGPDGPAVVHEQVGEQRAHLPAGHGDGRPVVGPHRQRPEHPESHDGTLCALRSAAAEPQGNRKRGR